MALTDPLTGLGNHGDAMPSEPLRPAVSVRRSITQDYLVCLEDGKKLKMLKRHLRTTYGLSPEEYRAKWKLPPDYPMVAPAYESGRIAEIASYNRQDVRATAAVYRAAKALVLRFRDDWS